VNGFIDHLFTPLGTTRKYNAIRNLNTLQIITAPAKSFPSLLCHQPFPGNGFKQWRFFSFTRLGSVFTASRAELNCQLPGWRPLHTNFLVFSSQPNFKLISGN
jgi:hypothetical protein